MRGPSFSISSSTLSVWAQSVLYDGEESYSKPAYGSTYTIRLAHEGLFGRAKGVSFPINSSQTSTFGSSWNTNKKVYVVVDNDGSFHESRQNLVGNGVVYNM